MGDVLVDTRLVDGLTLITLTGELDVAVETELRAGLVPSTGATRPDLAVDLRRVRFMDGSAAAALMATYLEIGAAGGCLRLITRRDRELPVLRLCGLDGVLCLHDSYETATAAVCERPHPPRAASDPTAVLD